MAIDLAHKQPPPDPADAEHRAGPAGLPPLTELASEQRDALNFSYRTTLSMDPRLVAGDPAAWQSDFGYALNKAAVRLDTRTDEELARDALSHPDPVAREQAVFEYADRDPADVFEVLERVVRTEKDREIRWDTLWAIEKLGGPHAMSTLSRFLDDPDPEIAEWSKLFLSELRTGDPAFDSREAVFTEGRTFDETIYLLIHCDLYIRLDDTNRHWGKLSLGPRGLARVYGQAHACPNVATRERQLLMAKTIDGLYEDGTRHMDNYLFRGFTDRTRADRGNFYFESNVPRTFYHSGRAADPSRGTRQTDIGFARFGTWFLDPDIQVRGEAAIRYVRGRFQGWGYTDVENMVGKDITEMLAPGNGILSTLHDPEVGPKTNVFILGTFKGKLNDWDGDGRIDLNSRDVYSTVDGELDSDQDGIPDEPGRTCSDHRPGRV
ncbi:HEAT repeat domain-containing protein [Nocardiopsis flavescens]|uniref:HEAT repeat domain-containing protein n=1 Tax=Nocardiopsis flavescens TaxID=758803 RepID=UPI00365C4056